jgi:hypothetical protein
MLLAPPSLYYKRGMKGGQWSLVDLVAEGERGGRSWVWSRFYKAMERVFNF